MTNKNKPFKHDPMRVDDDNLPQNHVRMEMEVSSRRESMHFFVPLPSPETLKGYIEIKPDAAERIFEMAEKAQDHRISKENKMDDFEILKAKLGMFSASLISISSIVAAVVCVFISPKAAANIGPWLVGPSLVGIVSLFLGRKKEVTGKNQKAITQKPNTK